LAVGVPVFAGIELVVAVAVFAALDGDIADLEEAGPDFGPGSGRGEEAAEDDEEAEHEHELGAHDDLEGAEDFAAEDEGRGAEEEDGGGEAFVEPPVVGDVLVVGELAAEDYDFDGNRGAGGVVGEDGAEIEQQIDDEPEPGARERAELATINRLAAVEGVAADFEVVERLKEDAEAGEPH
jgi:hypothetical protein